MITVSPKQGTRRRVSWRMYHSDGRIIFYNQRIECQLTNLTV
ncbi:hypothetical protein YSA_06891 [Pseudomonas putida ND6]|uniref:Uncharacterized protein n=1 Tax=Pseudomonas putida ND6 TaxID=231023 RepID=I3UYB1_PSEPU|nr:hypothetical protein YSA_06891 [Pseudomonas putida ND6]